MANILAILTNNFNPSQYPNSAVNFQTCRHSLSVLLSPKVSGGWSVNIFILLMLQGGVLSTQVHFTYIKVKKNIVGCWKYKKFYWHSTCHWHLYLNSKILKFGQYHVHNTYRDISFLSFCDLQLNIQCIYENNKC